MSANLDVRINGTSTGQFIAATTNDWKTSYWQFTATTSSTNICIYNHLASTGGNDFAFDDILLETFSFPSCVNSNTTNYPLVNGSNAVDPTSNYDFLSSNFTYGGNAIDNNLTNSVPIGNTGYVTVGSTNPNIIGYSNLDFPSGYFAGFMLDTLAQWNNSQKERVTTAMVTIVTYLNGVVKETKTGAALTVLPGFNTTTQNIGFYTTTKFDGIKIIINNMQVEIARMSITLMLCPQYAYQSLFLAKQLMM